MANKWDKEINRLENLSENEMIIGLSKIYDDIRAESKKVSAKWREAAPDENGQAWLGQYNRTSKLQDDISAIRPDYKRADDFIGMRYQQEYNTRYYRSAYTTVQEFRGENYNVNINKYTNSDFKKAVTNPLSKYTQPKLLRDDRGKSLNSLYNVIRQGIKDGEPLEKINRNLDKVLGYRDKKTGRLIAKPKDYKGDFSKRLRVLRTELSRIRSNASTDEWLVEQDQGIESDLIFVAVLDDRTRAQSAQMDGQKANEEGKFLYPDGVWYYQKNSQPQWDINDRCTTITLLSEDNIEDYTRARRIGKDSDIAPYQTFGDYAKSLGMTRNKYGQVLFPNS